MAQPDEQMRVLEEWLQLPESRRRHATDVVAFAYRLLRERPELLDFTRPADEPAGNALNNDLTHSDPQASLEKIVNWLLPHLHTMKPG
jgi:hypothetical protein